VTSLQRDGEPRHVSDVPRLGAGRRAYRITDLSESGRAKGPSPAPSFLTLWVVGGSWATGSFRQLMTVQTTDRIKTRASLVPAAAVIPARWVFFIVVVVKMFLAVAEMAWRSGLGSSGPCGWHLRRFAPTLGARRAVWVVNKSEC